MAWTRVAWRIVGRWLFRVLVRLGVGLALTVAGKVLGIRITRRRLVDGLAALGIAGGVAYLMRHQIADWIFGDDDPDAEIVLVPDRVYLEELERAGLIPASADPPRDLPPPRYFEGLLELESTGPGGTDWDPPGVPSSPGAELATYQRMSADESRDAAEAALQDIDLDAALVPPDQIIEVRARPEDLTREEC